MHRQILNDSVVEKALDDDNCAFNAFILALSQKDVIDQIEKRLKFAGKNPTQVFHDFLVLAAPILKTTPTWENLKAMLLLWREKNHEQLQRRLQPVIRHFAISLLEKDSEFCEETTHSLMAAFDDYIDKKRSETNKPEDSCGDDDLERALQESLKTYEHEYSENSTKGDDIYIKHEFIAKKFAELIENNLEANEGEIKVKKTALSEWWQKEGGGYKQFLEKMRMNGRWGGDFELSRLSHFFGMNLTVQTTEYKNNYFKDHGIIASALIPTKQRKKLIKRGVFEQPQTESDESFFIKASDREMNQFLSRVPDFAKVKKYIENNKENLVNQPLIDGEGFSKECIGELRRRGVIKAVAHADVDANFFAVADSREALSLIGDIKGKKKSQTILIKNRILPPTITLLADSNHWDNVRTLSKMDNSKIATIALVVNSLRTACKNYMDHLVRDEAKIVKYAKDKKSWLTELVTILNDDSITDDRVRVNKFATYYHSHEKAFKQGADGTALKLLKAIGDILFTALTLGGYFGARALYSSKTRGSWMFWQSRDDIFAEKVKTAEKNTFKIM